MVSFDAARNRIRIDPGHGVTGGGEPVVLPQPVELAPTNLDALNALVLNLSDLPEQQRLNTAFSLSRTPAEPARSRNGLFILALRPVEFTANPIAAYPTSISGQRMIEDSDIVEATAIILIPYAADPGAGDLQQRRARAAYDLFVSGTAQVANDQVLPLAMIGLEQQEIRWIDPFLVRREVGADHGDVLGLGFAPRAMREAFAMQYDTHFDEALLRRGRNSFAATEYFQALPPAGRMPAAAINPRDFTQAYFPPEVDIELSIVPDDEIAALMEESLLLPPIDLTLPAEAQESTSLLVLLPVPRRELRRLKNSLTTLTRTLRSAAPGLVARRTPLEALGFIRNLRPLVLVAQPNDPVEETWRQKLNAATTLWYIRRRNIAYRAEVVGTNLWMYSNEVADENALNTRITQLNLAEDFTTLKNRGSTAADAEIVSTLMSPRFVASRLLTEALIRDLDARLLELDRLQPIVLPPRLQGPLPINPIAGLDPRVIAGTLNQPIINVGSLNPVLNLPGAILRTPARLSLADVLVVTERYADPHLGEGLNRVQALREDLRSDESVLRTLASCGLIPELDQLCRKIDASLLVQFAEVLAPTAAAGDPAAVHKLIEDRRKEAAL
jgi:hypothetical protein